MSDLSNLGTVFEGKEKADRVNMAVEKQVQYGDAENEMKTGGDVAYVEDVKEVPQKTAWWSC